MRVFDPTYFVPPLSLKNHLQRRGGVKQDLRKLTGDKGVTGCDAMVIEWRKLCHRRAKCVDNRGYDVQCDSEKLTKREGFIMMT